MPSDWTIYRTRFLIKARQLDAALVFTDPLGREHRGKSGDYLVESSDGLRRIAPREIFEDIYVPMAPADAWPSLTCSPCASPEGHHPDSPPDVARRVVAPRAPNPRRSAQRFFIA